MLRRAYETLEKSNVRGAGGKVLADIVSLVRFALHQNNELRLFHGQVNERYAQWIMQREKKGRKFSDEQRQWLEAIRDHIATSLVIQVDDFDYVPFAQQGGLGKPNHVFGKDLGALLTEMNDVLAAYGAQDVGALLVGARNWGRIGPPGRHKACPYDACDCNATNHRHSRVGMSNQLPKGWAETSLGEISSKRVDGSHIPPPKTALGKPMLSARNVRDGEIIFDEF